MRRNIFILACTSILFLTSCISQKTPDHTAYLFAYFEGSGELTTQEQLRFAVSADAVHWKALNGNRPVIPSDEISQTGGIRDPHILRGEDGHSFYITATDMFTRKNGWEYNPGIVLLKSGNLTDWTHGIIDLEKSYPEKFAHIKWVWAPQTIYDPEARKYLVYFTVRFEYDTALNFYCAYANEDFTAFENEPQLMFAPKYGAIDGDIIHKDGTYHFFYKGNTKDRNGKELKRAYSKPRPRRCAARGKSISHISTRMPELVRTWKAPAYSN